VAVNGLDVRYGALPAVRRVTFDLRSGEIVALMGRNGAGKTTLLRSVMGLLPTAGGTVSVLGQDVSAVETEALARDIAFVPQEPAAVLYHRTVEEEVSDALKSNGRDGTVEDALEEWDLKPLRSANPLDLSVGERQRVALAAMLVGRPRVILLDEPTRGMDYETKEHLISNLRRRSDDGAAIVIASHDVELAGRCAERVLLLVDGELIVDGPSREVLADTLTFSTQVNKLYGGTFLTPEDVLSVQDGDR
jgi:energy-coupling factor transport system ATP-binding protein